MQLDGAGHVRALEPQHGKPPEGVPTAPLIPSPLAPPLPHSLRHALASPVHDHWKPEGRGGEQEGPGSVRRQGVSGRV